MTIVVLWSTIVDGPVPVIPPDPWANPGPGDPPVIDPGLVLQATLGNAIVVLA